MKKLILAAILGIGSLAGFSLYANSQEPCNNPEPCTQTPCNQEPCNPAPCDTVPCNPAPCNPGC